MAGSGGETVLLTFSVAGAKRTNRQLDLWVPLREPVLLGMAAVTLPVVAGLRLPVLPVGGAGSAKEEGSRPTRWPCVWPCQGQPLGCLSLPLAPHRATGSLGHLSRLLPVPPFFADRPGVWDDPCRQAGRGRPNAATVSKKGPRQARTDDAPPHPGPDKGVGRHGRG
jgi:hypothetical protein